MQYKYLVSKKDQKKFPPALLKQWKLPLARGGVYPQNEEAVATYARTNVAAFRSLDFHDFVAVMDAVGIVGYLTLGQGRPQRVLDPSRVRL